MIAAALTGAISWRRDKRKREIAASYEADRWVRDMRGSHHPVPAYAADDDMMFYEDGQAVPEAATYEADKDDAHTDQMPAVITDKLSHFTPEAAATISITASPVDTAVITAIHPPGRKPFLRHMPSLGANGWTDRDTDIWIRYAQQSMRAFMTDLIGEQELRDAEAVVATAGGAAAYLKALPA